MFRHKKSLILLQTVKKHLWRSLIFGKTTSGYLITSLKKEHSSAGFFDDLGGSLYKWFLILWCTWINNTATDPQIGIFNIKRKYFFRCLTSTRIKRWNMHTVFYEVFFISDKQLFYVMKFLNAMTSWKLQLHIF